MGIDYDAAGSYNDRQISAGTLTLQMIARVVEEWQKGHGLDPDGKCGPKTQESILAAMVVPSTWTPWDGPLAKQPRNWTDIKAMFGTPGDESSDWAKKNIIEVYGENAFPGVPGKWYVKVLRQVEPYVREGLRRAHISSTYKIDRCGGYVYRHSQYDDEAPLSYHAAGLALDFDPSRNEAKRFKPSELPKPWSPEWMKIWPNGVDREFVLAMKSCGYRWGGDWNLPGKDGLVFVDPMHFEWVGSSQV